MFASSTRSISPLLGLLVIFLLTTFIFFARPTSAQPSAAPQLPEPPGFFLLGGDVPPELAEAVPRKPVLLQLLADSLDAAGVPLLDEAAFLDAPASPVLYLSFAQEGEAAQTPHLMLEVQMPARAAALAYDYTAAWAGRVAVQDYPSAAAALGALSRRLRAYLQTADCAQQTP